MSSIIALLFFLFKLITKSIITPQRYNLFRLEGYFSVFMAFSLNLQGACAHLKSTIKLYETIRGFI